MKKIGFLVLMIPFCSTLALHAEQKMNPIREKAVIASSGQKTGKSKSSKGKKNKSSSPSSHGGKQPCKPPEKNLRSACGTPAPKLNSNGTPNPQYSQSESIRKQCRKSYKQNWRKSGCKAP
jgi:hypothetical protein